jgi:hypothetical protein
MQFRPAQSPGVMFFGGTSATHHHSKPIITLSHSTGEQQYILNGDKELLERLWGGSIDTFKLSPQQSNAPLPESSHTKISKKRKSSNNTLRADIKRHNALADSGKDPFKLAKIKSKIAKDKDCS